MNTENITNTSFLQHCPSSRQWDRIGIKPHHGFVIPLFSLHSAQSCGIGEYLDLLPMIEWCASLGLDLIQLLPLNDTGLETSPYSALSAFALNPIHLSLHALPYLDRFPLLQNEFQSITKNHSQRVDYPTVRQQKDQFLRHYYALAKRLIVEQEDYKKFVSESAWLNGYALFKTLKVEYAWKPWAEWPENIASPTSQDLQLLFNLHRSEMDWYIFIQYLCDLQMKKVMNHAVQHNLFIVGDIPILINRESADVWLRPDLFNLEYSAGSPPDMYSEEGQNWGFPIYNWKAMEEDGYKWWIERLQISSLYYHIYRLDHAVGFFRIWAIPLGKQGNEGGFIPENPAEWIEHGQKILMAMLNNCMMLPIAEDLGTVPPLVRACLLTLGICGTKVIRWEREWETTREFIPYSKYPAVSMTTVSTHDSETLQGWWKNAPKEAEDFADFKNWWYDPILDHDGQRDILRDSHHTHSLFHINLLQEYLVLVPGGTWPNVEDERINVPGECSDRNWSYKFKFSVEELTQNNALSKLIKELIV